MSLKSLSFATNFVTTPIGTVDTTISHGLNRIPLEGFIVWRANGSQVYRGAAAWTKTEITLRSDINTLIVIMLL